MADQGTRGGVAQASFNTAIRRVMVLADRAKADVDDFVQRLEPFLKDKVKTVHVEGDLRGWCKETTKNRSHTIDPAPDLVVVLGGDGSILSAVHAFAREPIPILGVNFGRVGFLASVPASDCRVAIEEVLAGDSVIEPRTRLAVSIQSGDGAEVDDIALNDIVLSRGSFQGMLSVSLEVDGHWVSDYRADGLIVATASGSTAHSLAAGGPILSPTMGGFVVTPICAHALSHRPVVLESDSEIKLTMAESLGVVTLAVDGHGFYAVQVGDRMTVRAHEVPYPLLTRRGSNPYRRLRDRLGWRGSFEAADREMGPETKTPDEGEGEVL